MIQHAWANARWLYTEPGTYVARHCPARDFETLILPWPDDPPTVVIVAMNTNSEAVRDERESRRFYRRGQFRKWYFDPTTGEEIEGAHFRHYRILYGIYPWWRHSRPTELGIEYRTPNPTLHYLRLYSEILQSAKVPEAPGGGYRETLA